MLLGPFKCKEKENFLKVNLPFPLLASSFSSTLGKQSASIYSSVEHILHSLSGTNECAHYLNRHHIGPNKRPILIHLFFINVFLSCLHFPLFAHLSFTQLTLFLKKNLKYGWPAELVIQHASEAQWPGDVLSWLCH